MGLFDELQQIKELSARTAESIGGPFGDPFNEVATVVSVADPKKLGRVKVEFQDGLISDWAYVHGSNKGVLSSQFVGASCLVGKAHGRSEDVFVLGFFNKNNQFEVAGTPVQIPLLDEQSMASSPPSPVGDQGLRCNEGNAGRVYLLENEINQDLVVCLRRNNRQEKSDEVWAWKSLTHGKWVEKGVDPGVAETEVIVNFSEKKGVPQCSKALEGEIHEFSEDRKFRSTMIMCRRDENGVFGWMPMSAPPLVFRTTLPKCEEKIHGMEAIVDSGRDSELAICLRYQGEMKWVHHRTREPLQFFKEEPPPTRQEFLDAKKEMPPLAIQAASPASQDFLGGAGGALLQSLGQAIPAVSGNSPLAQAASAIGSTLPGAFDTSQFLSNAATTALSLNSGLSPTQLASEFSKGAISPELANAFSATGGLGDTIAQGLKNNNLNQALQFSGQMALKQAITSLPPDVGSMFTGFASGGALGAIDVAAMLGVSQLPPEVGQFVGPVLSAGQSILSGQPTAINGVLNAAMGVGGQSLPGTIGGLVSAAGGIGGISPDIASGVLSSLQGGQFGPIAQALGGFAGLPGIPGLGGIAGVPSFASSALGLLGMGGGFASLLGPAGLGLSAFTALTGLDPISSILGGIPGIGGLLGGLFGGGPDCPCDPKCRKTAHGIDSDGLLLLHPCGSVIANSHSSYDPVGNPTANNLNRVAESVGRDNTFVGEELCVPNPFDLTQLIKSVKRIDEMADRIEHAKHADWPEMWSELSYTFEAIEKAFKQTDNNITGVESVERKLIDSQHRLITKLMVGNGSFFSKALISIVDASSAIRDLYGFVTALNAKKKGGKAAIFATLSLKTVFENITKIAALNAESKAEAVFNIANIVVPADSEWRKLAPGLDLISLTDLILGAVPIDIPLNFSRCFTVRDKNRILKDSLESKLNSLVPSEPEAGIFNNLPERIINPPRPSTLFPGLPGGGDAQPGSISDAVVGFEQNIPGQPGSGVSAGSTDQIQEILNQIKYKQRLSEDGEAEC